MQSLESSDTTLGATTVYLNGRFLEQPLSGVQRYGRELLRAIDHQLVRAGGSAPPRWVLLTTGAAFDLPPLRAITVRTCCSSLKSHIWDQWTLRRAARGGTLINFAGSGPIARLRQLVVIHDASPYRNPHFFSKPYGILHRQLGRLLARSAQICTVSHFSRGELAHFLGLSPSEIAVLPNGSEHMRRVLPDETILERLGLKNERFFVALGNLTPNKNLALVIEAVQRLGRARLVVVGGVNSKVFGTNDKGDTADGVIFAGRLADSEVAGLLRHALALVFPSFYEGFGIPPLEAMVNDCPVIASAIPAVEEVCGDAALYFAPDSPDHCVAAMRAMCDEGGKRRAKRIIRGRERAALFSWERTASDVIELANSMTCDGQNA